MSALQRTYASGFTLSDSHTLEELEGMSADELSATVIPTEEIFKNHRKVTLPPFFARLAHSGLEIYLKKIGVVAEIGEKIRLYDSDGFFALGEVREFNGGEVAIKPIRQF